MSTHERSEATAYLLGELDPEQAAAFEHALADDAALRAEVERLRPVVSRLERLPADAWEDEEPPPLRLPEGLVGNAPAAEPTTGPASPAAPRASRRSRFRRPLTLRPAFAAGLAAALLAVGIGIGALVDTESGGPTRTTVVNTDPPLALRPIGDTPGAQGRALVARGGQPHVTLRVAGLSPSRPGQFYEVWLMNADGKLLALGSFSVTRERPLTLALPLPVDPTEYQYFDISVQPDNGSAAHSGDSVLRGPTRI